MLIIGGTEFVSPPANLQMYDQKCKQHPKQMILFTSLYFQKVSYKFYDGIICRTFDYLLTCLAVILSQSILDCTKAVGGDNL